VLAVSCHNWGTLIPRHDHGLRNAEAWAEKARQCGFLGVMSTAWASAHVPLAVQQFHVAATAQLFGAGREKIDDAWQVQFLSEWFGTDASAMPEALRQASVQWEVRVEGLSRPLTFLPYGYMDLVLHFPGGHGDRLWYTMPLVDGESLRDLLRREGRLSIPRAIAILRDIAEAAEGYYLMLSGGNTMELLYERRLAPLPKAEHAGRQVQKLPCLPTGSRSRNRPTRLSKPSMTSR
jgi:hypothetical protein